ncbi:MAG: hypothetical protein ABR518_02030 [Actinomycetota bacterium]
MTGRRILAAALVAAAATLIPAPPAAPQAGGSLVVVSPKDGSTTDTDVLLVVTVVGASSKVRFVATLDGAPASLEDAATGRVIPVASASPGNRTTVYLRALPEGPHTLRVIPVSSDAVGAPPPVRFRVQARGLTLPFVLIAVGGLALILLFRRRILGAAGDRYERASPSDTEDDE